MRAGPFLLATVLSAGWALAACGRDAPTSGRAPAVTRAAPPSSGAAPSSSAAPTKTRPGGAFFPPEARRQTPPAGIETRALAVGATAPAIDLAATVGSRWALADHLRDGPAVLVFYRGFW